MKDLEELIALDGSMEQPRKQNCCSVRAVAGGESTVEVFCTGESS